MNKCHGISWEGRGVGSTVVDSLLPLSVTVLYLCSALQKLSFISPNIAIKTLWSKVPHGKPGVAQQVIFFMVAEDKKKTNKL
jgi:hypothetical protein